MFRASDSGGWFVESDEAAVLSYLRGLPDAGSGYPFATARNGSSKADATAFATDREGYIKALKVSSQADSADASAHDLIARGVL